MQKSPQLDRKIVEREDVAPTPFQVCLGSTVSSNTGDLVSQLSAPSNLTCGRVLPIKMIFPSFGGVHDENDPLVYLERCKDFLALRPMSNSEILATMRSVLHASARDWWVTVRFKVGTWESFQQAFLAVFLPEVYQDVLEDQVRNRLQGANESVRDFTFSFQALFKHWKKEATEDEVLKALLKAMNPCFASQLRGRAQTVEELVRLGTQIERDYDHQRKYNQLQLSKSTTFDQNSQARKIKEVEPKAILPSEQRNPSLLCWRCHENHSPGSCPNFKASLSGKHSGGHAQGGREPQVVVINEV